MRRRRAAAAIVSNNNNNNDPSIGSVPARFHGGGPRFSISSAPATPLGGSVSSIPMELGLEYIDKEHDNEYYLDCGSIASCEEASEATTTGSTFGRSSSSHHKHLLSPDGVTSAVLPLQRAFKKRDSKSRLSLKDEAASSPPEAGGRTTPSSGSNNTAGILPKFLRSSFRGLFKGGKPEQSSATPTAIVPEPDAEGEGSASPPSSALAAMAMRKSSTFQNLVNSAKQNESERAKAAGAVSNTCHVCQCHSPTTEAYLEENRLNGLPVIPFAFPTSVVAEKMWQRRKKPSGDSDKSPGAENKTLPQDIVRRNVSLVSMDQLYPGEFDFGGPKSLENLVYIAQRELISESLLRGEDIDIPFMLAAGASASSMETGTAYSAASDDVDDEIASLNSHRNNREDSDVGIVMVAASEDANKTPVVRPPPLTSRQDSGGYFEMAPLTATTTAIRKGNSFSPPKGGFSRKSSGPSPSSPPRITAQRPSGDALLSPTAPVAQRPSATASGANDDFFEMDFSGSGGGGNRT